MVDNKNVPSKPALDKLIRMKEKGEFIVDDEWNTRKGGQTRPSILLEKERFHALWNKKSSHLGRCESRKNEDDPS